ncbi:MAG: hypothetical protein ACTSVG_14950 [Alphaproteobacteria bacterium]
MELIADGLLIATAMTAGLYCLVLSRRLRRLTDSGNSIGPQIEALDRALGDTRAALAETREGVLELRSSTKTAFDELTRETARGKETADLIERGVEEAKATLQRLYEAADRIEAYENRPKQANHAGAGSPAAPLDEGSDAGAGEGAPVIEPPPDAGDDPAVGGADDNAESAGSSGGAGSEDGPKVALPEGRLVKPEAVEAAPVASVETAGERTGTVLKAERVML